MSLRKNSSNQEFLTQRRISGAQVWRRWWSLDRESLGRLGSIAFVMVLAAGIRLLGLNQIGFNTDEAVYSGQAAAIAQIPVLKDIFPVFRAHPLLFQFLLAAYDHVVRHHCHNECSQDTCAFSIKQAAKTIDHVNREDPDHDGQQARREIADTKIKEERQ